MLLAGTWTWWGVLAFFLIWTTVLFVYIMIYNVCSGSQSNKQPLCEMNLPIDHLEMVILSYLPKSFDWYQLDSNGINSYEYCLGTYISARPLKSGTNTNNIEQPNKCSDMVQTCANYFPRRQRKPRKSMEIQEILCTQCLSCQSTLPFNAAVLQSKCAGRSFREERKVGEPQCPQCADIICIWPKMTKGCLVTLRLPETTLPIQPPT